jgi:predicted nucleic acid-binding protein
LTSEFQAILRRLKPERRHQQLNPRPRASLAFIDTVAELPSKLLYDTTVYIDCLQGRFPHNDELVLRASDAWHSTVTEAELAAVCGLLDPSHPQTQTVVRQISAVVEKRPHHRTLAPDRHIWREAGILTGLLARLQKYSKADHRRALNDALLFSTARKYRLTVLTRNINDFDLLQQLDPSGRVLFYSV